MNYDDEHTKANIHALIGIRTHGVSVQAIKAYASDCKATWTGYALVKNVYQRLYKVLS
jgi:hypothetical protein